MDKQEENIKDFHISILCHFIISIDDIWIF